MIKEALRVVAIFLLLIIIIMDDFPFYKKMKDPTTQMFLALTVLAFIYYDATFGFIMGLVLLLIYYEIYKKIIYSHEIKETRYDSNDNTHTLEEYRELDKIDYITDAHLLAAQNNIFDVANFHTGISGVSGIGAQGLDMGFDKDDKYATI